MTERDVVYSAFSGKQIGTVEKVKCILFTSPDGAIHALPLKYVAEARAKYYAAKDPDTTFDEEVKFVMEDDYEGIDWFRNNQNPEDFMELYHLVKRPDEKSIEDRISEAEASLGDFKLFIPTPEST